MTEIVSSEAGWRYSWRRERAARDEEFTAFVAAATPRLRRTAYLMCRDWHLAQDLTQLTLAKMYASWGRIWRTANLEAYSRRVLMNAVFDRSTIPHIVDVNYIAHLPDALDAPFALFQSRRVPWQVDVYQRSETL